MGENWWFAWGICVLPGKKLKVLLYASGKLYWSIFGDWDECIFFLYLFVYRFAVVLYFLIIPGFIDSFISQSVVRSSVRPSVRSLVHSFIRSFVHSFICLPFCLILIRSFICWFSHSFMIYLLIHFYILYTFFTPPHRVRFSPTGPSSMLDISNTLTKHHEKLAH